jgi:hypothetical protein
MAWTFRAILGGISLAALSAGLAAAEPISAKEARKMLFSPKGAEVEMIAYPFLSAADSALLQQVAQSYTYYAAVAVAPGEELLKSEATILVANYHSSEAASDAALAGCNAVRKSEEPCEIVALVRPEKWEGRDFQLSAEGTQALRSDYGRFGPRAMAISVTTGFFGLGKGDAAGDAALAACTEKGATDCAVVVTD